MNDIALMNGFVNESAPALSRRRTRGQTAYCIPCAVSTSEFKERAPLSYAVSCDPGLQARAWINGRSYHLVRHPEAKIVCMSCGREVAAAYVPEER